MPNRTEVLQAFGRDARGRLQYRYHPDFIHSNAMRKWRRLARFAAALPRLREVTTADLRLSRMPHRKVLALLTRLLQYEDQQGTLRPVQAAELNAYLRESIGPFTAKDFRTWGGTLRAAEFLAAAGPADNDRAAARILVECVKVVAAAPDGADVLPFRCPRRTRRGMCLRGGES